MKRMPLMQLLIAAVASAALCLPIPASAQYAWFDEKGTKHFSDMPPPPSVPANRILKQPGKSAATPPAQETGEEKSAVPSRTEPTTIAEKNADFRKRRAEQAEKEKKAAEEAAQAAEKAKNCARAREYQRSLDFGERISRIEKNGERAYLTDEQRAQESRDNRRILDDCK